MKFSKATWGQLKSKTSDDLIRALRKDGWKEEFRSGATRAFIKYGTPNRRIVIHYHPKKTYTPGLLKALLRDTGWTENDFRRLKLIKK